MSIVGFSPSMQIFDPKTGLMTRDGFMLVQFFVEAVNGAGAVLTNDGIQTLTNKTIDGDSNTLQDIPTSALKLRTGEDARVVTGTAGVSGTIGVWDGSGDLIEGETQANLLTISAAAATYLPLDGSQAMNSPITLASFAVADVPAAASYTAAQIYVSNEIGGAIPAFSDGTNWRRVTDRAIIS